MSSPLLRRWAIMQRNNLLWLSKDAQKVIISAFGVSDGRAIIEATQIYFDTIYASGSAGQTKAIALASYVNEDPMMVCSLGLQPQGVTMPRRCIVFDGKAYIDSLLQSNQVDEVEYSARFYNTNAQIEPMFNGRASKQTEYKIYCQLRRLSHKFGMNFSTSQYGSFVPETTIDVVSNTVYDIHSIIRDNYQYLSVNGVVGYNGTNRYVQNGSFRNYIGAFNGNGSLSTLFVGDFAHAVAKYNNNTVRDYIPMKLGKAWAAADVSNGVAQPAGTCGMIDIISGKFFPNANTTGQFTIPDIVYPR